MKTIHIVLLAVGGIVVYKVFLAPKPKSPIEQITGGFGSIIQGIGGLSKTDKPAARAAAPGGALDLTRSSYSTRMPTTGFVSPELG